MVDVASGLTSRPVTIEIAGGFIQSITQSDVVSRRPTIDGEGLVAAPGLIDSHVHFFFDAGHDPVAAYQQGDDTARLATAARNADIALSAGITTMRDLGGPLDLMETFQGQIQSGRLRGPHLISSGAPLTRRGGHCHFFGGEVSTPDEIRALVKKQADHGATCVKVMASGGGMTPGTRPYEADFPLEMMTVARQSADELDMTATAHCHATEAIRRAIAAGIQCIEHASFMEPPGVPRFDGATAAALRERDVLVCPTVASGVRAAKLYRERGRPDHPEDSGAIRRLEFRAEVASGLHEQGVQLLAGSDAGSDDTPFNVLIEEIEALSSAGLSTAEAIQAATVVSARHLRLAQLGEVKVGYRADLTILTRDPLVDLTALRTPAIVIKSGVVVSHNSYSVQP